MHTVHLSTGKAGHAVGHPSVWHESRLHEPTCLWLNEEIVPRSQSPNTWAQAARSVVSWLDFLEASAVDWRHASRSDLVSYRDAYLLAISPQTGQRYSPQTVRTRMVYIIDFIEYALARGWTDSDISGDVSGAVQGTGRPLRPVDQDALAHIRKGAAPSGAGRVRKLLPKAGQDETVRVLRREELAALLRWAGPRPSQRKDGDGGCDRDRIVFDMAWAIGR